MRVYFDDEERALLAARLGQTESVSDADLAASVAAWIESKPVTPASGRRLTAADLENMRVVADADSLADYAQEGGYAHNQTGWLGAG